MLGPAIGALSLITAFGYLCAYLYELGFSGVTGVPLDLVDLTSSDAAWAAIRVFGAVVVVTLLFEVVETSVSSRMPGWWVFFGTLLSVEIFYLTSSFKRHFPLVDLWAWAGEGALPTIESASSRLIQMPAAVWSFLSYSPLYQVLALLVSAILVSFFT
jgi:hypothetical protein